MKKVISLVLAAVMLLSVFAVLPTASAAETVYKAGTEIQMLWKFPNIDAFTGVQFIVYYGESLEYVKGSVAYPNVNRGSYYSNDKIANEINFNASDVSEPYDLSADHIMCQANFIVKEDTTDLGFASEIEELYIRNYEATGWDDMFVDVDRTNEFEVVVVSAPTEPEPKTVYFVNSADWANVNAYAWNSVSDAKNADWPGVAATKTELTDPNGKDVYSYTFTEDFDKIIFNDGSGSQTGDLVVSEGVNKYYNFADSLWYDSLDAIPLMTITVSLMGTATDWTTGMEMTEADGIYTATLDLAEGTYEFQVKINDDWYGNGGTVVDTTTTSSEAGWDMYKGAANLFLEASGGTYTFNFDLATKKIIILAEIEEKPTEDTEPTEDTTPEDTTPEDTTPEDSEPTEDTTPAESRTVYFVPNNNWKSDNARFAAYVFVGDGSNEWISFADEDGDGIYQGEISETYNDIIFIRMNPTSTDNNWENRWNQTVDLVIPNDGKNLFTQNEGEWDNANGTWSVYPPVEDTTPSEDPSEEPSEDPSEDPSEEPSENPSENPSEDPSEDPSEEPSEDTTPSVELKNGIYDEDGTLYYYKDGAKYYAGLIMIDGDYYYVNSSCVVVTGKKYSISKTNYLLPRDVYEFGEDGKMLNPPVKETTEATEAPAVKNGIYEEDGVLYYYKDGAKNYGGLIMIGEDYYYVNSSCKVITGRAYYVSKTNNLLPSASYTFGLDGKMLNPPVEETTESTEGSGVKNGFVVENGVTYYYVDDVKTYAGLIEIDGDLYYVNSSCRVIMGKKYYVSKTNGLKERGSYTFDATGKLVG